MLLPISLDVKKKRCLVVGGGPVAARKVRSLLECGAHVVVVSPQMSDDFFTLLDKIECFHRCFEAGDCEGMRLIFACTNRVMVNSEVCEEAQQLGIWCNVADSSDNPQLSGFNAMPKVLKSDFKSAAVIRRGRITVAISTDGGSPALSKHLKSEIENVIGDEYAQLLQLMSDARSNRVLDNQQNDRANRWRAILRSDVLELLRNGKTDAASERVDEILNAPAPNEP